MILAPLTQTSQEGIRMGTWWNDFKNSVLNGLSQVPEVLLSGVNNGGYIDMKEAQEGLFAMLQTGDETAGGETATMTLEEADDAGGTNNQAITDFITGNPATTSALVLNSLEILNFKRSKRFVRAVLTVAGTTGIAASASIHGMRRRVL